jgi:hypothetical protein
MAKELLPDALWARIAPLLPPESPHEAVASRCPAPPARRLAISGSLL